MGTKARWEGAFDATYNLAKDWLSSILKSSRETTRHGEILNRAKSSNAIISEFFPLSESIYHMEKLAPTCEIPTSWVHGDFCHGNLIIDFSNNKMWVTDFAFSAPDEIPIDVLDLVADYNYRPSFLLNSGRLSKYWNPSSRRRSTRSSFCFTS